MKKNKLVYRFWGFAVIFLLSPILSVQSLEKKEQEREPRLFIKNKRIRLFFNLCVVMYLIELLLFYSNAS